MDTARLFNKNGLIQQFIDLKVNKNNLLTFVSRSIKQHIRAGLTNLHLGDCQTELYYILFI